MEGILRNMTAIYLIKNEQILLLYRVGSRVVAPSWCGIGGHFEKDELNDAKKAVLREMKEEIGLCENDIDNLKMRDVTLRNKNGEIRQNYYFFAELKDDVFVPESCDEGRLEWVDMEKVCEREMPFTAKNMLEHYLSTGRYTDVIYGGVTAENGTVFIEMNEF